MKHVIFLDVDGVLLRFPTQDNVREFYAKYPEGAATPKVHEFLKWLNVYFEVRWLTAWCPSGWMNWERRRNLSQVLNVPESLLQQFDHKHPWGEYKTDAIDFTEFQGTNRQFRWIDDEILPKELLTLERWGVTDWWIKTDCNDAPERLQEVWTQLHSLI